MNVFISYSSKDADIANNICSFLELNNLECFIAPRNIRPGHLYAEEIIFGLESSDLLLLLLSENSNASAHVLREVEWAVSNNIPIITYKLEEVTLNPSMKYFLMATQWMDANSQGDYIELASNIIALDSTGADGAQNIKNSYIENSYKQDSHTIKDVNREKTEKSKNNKSGRATAKKTNKTKHNDYTRFIALGASCLVLILLIILVVKGFNKDNKPIETVEFITNNTSTDNISTDTTASNTSAEQAEGSENPDTTVDEDTTPTIITPGTDSQTDVADSNKTYNIGDYVSFGSYNGESIDWRVIYTYDDGSVTMITDKIITFKAFDAAESGKAYYDNAGNYIYPADEVSDASFQQAYGSNNWMSSTLRFWLNSKDKKVSYIGQKPTAAAMCDGGNGYDDESGFLYGFTEKEIAAIKNSRKDIAYYNDNGSMSFQSCDDLVYLLSCEQIPWLEGAGINVYEAPTASAKNKDSGLYYKEYSINNGTNNAVWWLLECQDMSPTRVSCMSNGIDGEIYHIHAFTESIGVRPVITIDTNNL